MQQERFCTSLVLKVKVYGTGRKLPIVVKSLVTTIRASPGGRGYSWEFLVGVCRSPNPDPNSDQKMSFHIRFQTRPLKSIPVFRPGLWAENMSSLLRLESKQKISSNAFRICMFLFSRSYSFGIEKTSMFIHSRSSPENHTRFQTKMGKSIPVFRPKRPKIHTLCGGTNLHGLYKGVPPPLPRAGVMSLMKK